MNEIAKRPVPLGAPQGTLDDAYRLAGNLSLSNLLPVGLRGKQNDVFVTLLYGQELGLQPMQAIQSIYVVNGRPTISAQLWVALARGKGHKVRKIDEGPEHCTVEVVRSDDPDAPVRVTYTLEQARAAKLTSKDVWTGHRAAMLWARASSTACRQACPEVAMGFGDEYDLAPDPEPVQAGLARVVAEREQRAEDEARPEPDDAETRAELERMDQAHTAETVVACDDDPTLPDDPDLHITDQED